MMLVASMICCAAWAQEPVGVKSPDGRIRVELKQNTTSSYLIVFNADSVQMVKTQLGLTTSIGGFSSKLVLQSASAPERITDTYENRHGKQLKVTAEANQVVLHFLNSKNLPMDVEVRAYNDGVAFRYVLPNAEKQNIKFNGETTAYIISQSAHRWLQQFVTSYEGDFPYQASSGQQGAWGYPALFEVKGTFMLLTEANVNRSYCATHLDNSSSVNSYKVTYPYAWEGNNQGDVNPTWDGEKWTSPWRLAIIGDLKDVVESTLVEDVCDATTMTDTDWIQPGRASWIYWAYNHGTKDYKICCQYVDLAVKMGWEYVLFDWEWDAMTNGGKLEDAVAYAKRKGVKPLMWYNSGGPHNQIGATPRDRMLTHENRMAEFAWLKSIGVVGVKIDFFESDKQSMMAYYQDILEDAASVQMLVNFHGSTVPRGWSRTYPHLMSMEAVYGAEQYNNGDYMTSNGARINCLLPYTRNVIGPMDYTPVAFTNSQHPHTTTFAHELALSVAFESGIQHWADRPEGFYALPDEAKWHMMQVPVAWDETRFLNGYPGKSFVVARRSGDNWYVGALNGEKEKKTFNLGFDFLKEGHYMLTCHADGADEKTFAITHHWISAQDSLSITSLSQGGFTMDIVPFTASLMQKMKDAAETLLKKAKANMGAEADQYKELMVNALDMALEQANALSDEVGEETLAAAYISLADAYSALQTSGINKREFTQGDAVQPNAGGTDVTKKYLKENKGFARNTQYGTQRFGAPSYWTVENYEIDNGSSGVKRGLDNYPGYNCLQLGRWEESDGVMTAADHTNSRLYQRVTLPAGRYYFGAKYHSLENGNVGSNAYLMVASDVLPTKKVKTDALAWCTLRTASTGDQFYGLIFKLTEQQEVVLGWQMDGSNKHTEFRCSEVKLLYEPFSEEEVGIQSPSSQEVDTPTEYFSLSGVKMLSAPVHGIYLQKRGNRIFKRVIR